MKGAAAASNGAGQDVAAVSAPATGPPAQSAATGFWRHAGELIRTIRDGNDAMVEAAVVQLSRRRRILAPLALAVGALAMLFHGLRLLLSNWRLTFVQILPAMWIWAAMLDLKLHVLHGASFREWRGWGTAVGLLRVSSPTIDCGRPGRGRSPPSALSACPCAPSCSLKPGPAMRRYGETTRWLSTWEIPGAAAAAALAAFTSCSECT